VSIDDTEEEQEEEEATVEIRLFVSPARSISGERRKDLLAKISVSLVSYSGV
jgi:hypothetical protein